VIGQDSEDEVGCFHIHHLWISLLLEKTVIRPVDGQISKNPLTLVSGFSTATIDIRGPILHA